MIGQAASAARRQARRRGGPTGSGGWLGCGRGTILAGAVLLAAAAHGAETLLLNESAAQQCYLAALGGGDARDIELCTVALEHQSLKKADFAATLSNRGLLLTRSDRFDDALADHDRAISMKPEVASLYINRANTYTRAKRFDEAMRDLDRAIDLAGKTRAAAQQAAAAAPPPEGGVASYIPGGHELAAAHYNRALLFQRQGNFAAAIADARRASELIPERPGYRAYLQELERLSTAPRATPAG
jgi:tetratricopeptide (TPR) repeat protein